MVLQGDSRRRMGKAQAGSVQEVPLQSAKPLVEFFVASLAVYIVSNDRTADRSEMNSDLVCASRFDPNFKKGETMELF